MHAFENFTSPAKRLALRMDDVGASSKRYEVYSDTHWHIGGFRISGNWLFLKYLPPFRRWGPYRELRPEEWRSILDLLEKYQARLTVAVTAAWVEAEHRLIPFPERYPAQADVLKSGLQRGLLEIANHGLTHCVLAGNAFKPKWFQGNRRFHREFWDWLPIELHEKHISQSQTILQEFFEVDIVSFVPPGNVFTEETLRLATQYGLRYTSCDTPLSQVGSMQVLGNHNVLAFHDRELVLEGLDWLENLLQTHHEKQLVTLSELAQTQKVKL